MSFEDEENKRIDAHVLKCYCRECYIDDCNCKCHKKEFNLSEKIQSNDFGSAIWIKDIKEFIKRLKDKLLNYQYQTNPQLNEYCHKNIIKQTDKLAGPKLS